MHIAAFVLMWPLLALPAQEDDSLPIVEVDRDNIAIDESCRVHITADVIRDADQNGVIHINADDITIVFADDREHRELLGAPDGTPWDQCQGIGIRVDGHRNVTIRGAHCHRFKVGIYASNADELTLEDCDVAGGYAHHLKSTPEAEDTADWLWPHDNFNNEWMHNYGAGIYVEDSNNAVIHGCYARRRQNGIIIDNVNQSTIYDNDCSFLSGWGLAMWKSSENTITRNAFDFCIRGYSHGVYNRGQDSAGILMFEQCSYNTIAHNSATHSGDGVFGFAGKEALGEVNPREDRSWYEERGCNNNLLIGNDFSYAAAHGIELTFSFGNRFYENRLIENAICGVWGGYAQDTLIAGNTIERNGDMAYGLERGGINIEHGVNNQIKRNRFKDNACGVHLWWDNDEHIFERPWYRVNENEGAQAAAIFGNTFEGDDIALQFRNLNRRVLLAANDFRNVDRQQSIDGDVEVEHAEILTTQYLTPQYQVFGGHNPVGARASLRGRDRIIMTEWFPFDWRDFLLVSHGPMIDDTDRPYLIYRLLGPADEATDAPALHLATASDALVAEHEDAPDQTGVHRRLRVTAKKPGVHRVNVRWTSPDGEQHEQSTHLVFADWTIRHFQSPVDPRDDVQAWRAAGQVAPIVQHKPHLDERWATSGPEQLKPDQFGTIATTALKIPAGRWRLNTTSDDGIRVWMNGETVIDDWTWHAPKQHTHVFELNEAQTIDLRVEHFELDGYAMLTVAIEAVEHD